MATHLDREQEQFLDTLKRLSLNEFNFNENASRGTDDSMPFLTGTNFKDRISALISPECIPETAEELGAVEGLLKCAARKLGIPESTVETILAQAAATKNSTGHVLPVAADKATIAGVVDPGSRNSPAQGPIAVQEHPNTNKPEENGETNTNQEALVGQGHTGLQGIHENREIQVQDRTEEAFSGKEHEDPGNSKNHSNVIDGIQRIKTDNQVHAQECPTNYSDIQSENEGIDQGDAAQEGSEIIAVQSNTTQGIDIDDEFEGDYEDEAKNSKFAGGAGFGRQYPTQNHDAQHVQHHGDQKIGVVEYYTPGADSVGISSMAHLRACHSVDSDTTNSTTLRSLENSGDDNFNGKYIYPDPDHNKSWDKNEIISNIPTRPKNPDPESAVVLTPQKYICGIRSKVFYTGLAVLLLVIVASVLGAVFGTSVNRNKGDSDVVLDPMEKLSSTRSQIIPMYPTPTFTAYPLETGPWEINEFIDVEEGICGSHPQAIDRCWNPYKLKFNILKAPQGFKVETEMGLLNDKYLYPPQSPEGMYSFNVTDFEFPSYFEGTSKEAKCNTSVDAFFMLGRNYKFHLSFTYKVTRRCEKWTGFVAEAGQTCHCEWKGYVFDEFKGKPELTTTLKFTPTPTLKSTDIHTIAETSITETSITETPITETSIAETSSVEGITDLPISPIMPISVLAEPSAVVVTTTDSSVDELQKTQNVNPHTSTVDSESTNTIVTAPPVLE